MALSTQQTPSITHTANMALNTVTIALITPMPLIRLQFTMNRLITVSKIQALTKRDIYMTISH